MRSLRLHVMKPSKSRALTHRVLHHESDLVHALVAFEYDREEPTAAGNGARIVGPTESAQRRRFHCGSIEYFYVIEPVGKERVT